MKVIELYIAEPSILLEQMTLDCKGGFILLLTAENLRHCLLQKGHLHTIQNMFMTFFLQEESLH